MSRPQRSSHYDTLGVPPNATADQIRAAYRRAARDAHPDRHGDASSARMAEINEAWRVLGDPVRRQRYDGEASASDGGGPVGSAAPSGPGRVEGGVDRDAWRDVVPTGDLSRFPWRFFAVVGVFAVGVVLFGSLLSEPPAEVPPDNFLRQGDCVMIDEATLQLAEVACVPPYDAKVQVVLNFGDQCPTGTERYNDPRGRGEACVYRVPE